MASEPAELPAPVQDRLRAEIFRGQLSLADQITAWRAQPVASLQLVTIVLLLSMTAVVTASVR